MLKLYVGDDHIRWTGKAWEIRHAIRRELKRSGGHLRVAELLSPSRAGKRGAGGGKRDADGGK